MAALIPTAEPFFFPGSRTGCLLVHGFTGSPKEMRWLGEYLSERGYSVLCPRLAGHATRPEDMIRTRWTDWTCSVEDGYDLLRGAADRIYLIGLSMGGALALLMSTRLDVAGVVAMSTPLRLPVNYPAWLLRLLSVFVRFQPKGSQPPGSGWFDQAAYAGQVSYSQNPVRSIAELQLLLAEVRAALPRVTAPTLLLHSRDDRYVNPENMEQIHARLGAADKQMRWLTGSGHVVTRDASRQAAFRAVAEFIEGQEHK
jgi:carboxylesterase